jgi:DNA-binding NarL/FixJ family response regulator
MPHPQTLGDFTREFTGPLSSKERFVLQALADGSVYADIAEAISSSRNSVKNMAWRASIKLGAENKTHAVAMALRRSLIQ